MNDTIKNLLCFSSLLLIFCCGTENDMQDIVPINETTGTIILSGVETSELGTALSIGNIEVANTALTGTDKSVILLSDNISVSDNEFVYDDDQNGFVIVAADFSAGGSTSVEKTISMTIVKNGVEYRHACSTPNLNIFTDCGENFRIDFDGNTVIFDNTTVINTDNDSILTLDGTVTWN
ncbi:conserved hypothetical protein [Maribacter litoralis]|uniref:Uncharacterized protein n=2 Tax=Maribacter litoralis TaxID=2059726 RepID=A0A653R2T6_9FLAO|nr:conserved hypothetical protein [Maribacter litoralis]